MVIIWIQNSIKHSRFPGLLWGTNASQCSANFHTFLFIVYMEITIYFMATSTTKTMNTCISGISGLGAFSNKMYLKNEIYAGTLFSRILQTKSVFGFFISINSSSTAQNIVKRNNFQCSLPGKGFNLVIRNKPIKLHQPYRLLVSKVILQNERPVLDQGASIIEEVSLSKTLNPHMLH